MHTLIVPLKVYNANVLTTPHASGLPGSTGITGFGHALIRLIHQLTGVMLEDKGTGMAVNTYSLQEGRPRHVLAGHKKNADAANGKMSSVVDERLATFDLNILVRFDCDMEKLTVLRQQLTVIASQVNRLNFSGGAIEVSGSLVVVEDDHTGLAALELLPYDARLLVDKTFVIQQVSELFEEDALDATLRLLKKSEEQNKDYRAFADKSAALLAREDIPECPDEILDMTYWGTLSAIHVGYRAIESPRSRETRQGDRYQHVYAEPVIGLCRLQSVGSYLATQSNLHNQCSDAYFWQHLVQHPYYVSLETMNHE